MGSSDGLDGLHRRAVAQQEDRWGTAARRQLLRGFRQHGQTASHSTTRGATRMAMPRRRKTASSRVSGLLRTQRRCRRAFSLPLVWIWARRAAQTRPSGFFLKIPAVFCYFWNATAGAETAGLIPAAAPGPIGRHSEHAFASWVCAQAVSNAQTAAFCVPNSVFWGHISGAFRRRGRASLGPNIAHTGNKTQPPPENRPWRGNLKSIFPIVKSIWPGAKRAEKIDDLFPKA